jgi:hypothetical protein
MQFAGLKHILKINLQLQLEACYHGAIMKVGVKNEDPANPPPCVCRTRLRDVCSTRPLRTVGPEPLHPHVCGPHVALEVGDHLMLFTIRLQLVGNPSCIVKKERRLQYIRHVRSCRGRGQGRGPRATRAGQRAARCEVQKHKPTTANAPRMASSSSAFNFRVGF